MQHACRLHINHYIYISIIVLPYLWRYQFWKQRRISASYRILDDIWKYEKVSCKIDTHSFLLVMCTILSMGWFARSRHISTMVKFAVDSGWNCLQKRCSIWNQDIIVLTLFCKNPLQLGSSVNVNVKCFAKGVCIPITKWINVVFLYFIILLLIYSTD